MKKFLSKYWKASLSLAFGVAVFLFWRYGYYYALSYQEQFQLFLFDSDYFMERLAQPGGLARYLGEFVVQFYNSSTIGALLIAILYVALQRLTYLILLRRMKNDKSRDTSSFLYSLLFALSFLPPITLWFVMGDENVMLTYVIALIIAMLFMLIGPMVLLTAFVLMPLSVIYALVCIFISAYWVPYPLSQLMVGVDYYRFVDILPYSLFLVPVLVLALCYGVRYLPKVKLSVCYALAGVVVLLMVLVCIFGYDTKKYELIEYDYLVRIKDWNGIIAKAEKKTPDLPMSVCATNLALAITNQLGDRAFDFYQRGREGLLPPFERNFTTAQLTGEIYYYLGLINTAQRFAFESMEALPNYNKSGRIIKRLVETNMINGQYEVARKYLQLLEKTIFYRPWAEKTLTLLQNPQQINQHPVYGWLRKVRLQDDFLFSEDEVDKICGQLFMHNTKNAMAMQYLLMTPLLDRDLNRFMQYLQVVQEKVRYNPRVCQEAVCLAFAQRNQQPPQGSVNQMILRNFSEFVQAYGGQHNPAALSRFKQSTWYYLMVGE